MSKIRPKKDYCPFCNKKLQLSIRDFYLYDETRPYPLNFSHRNRIYEAEFFCDCQADKEKPHWIVTSGSLHGRTKKEAVRCAAKLWDEKPIVDYDSEQIPIAKMFCWDWETKEIIEEEEEDEA